MGDPVAEEFCITVSKLDEFTVADPAVVLTPCPLGTAAVICSVMMSSGAESLYTL